jgi:hypothetical protein
VIGAPTVLFDQRMSFQNAPASFALTIISVTALVFSGCEGSEGLGAPPSVCSTHAVSVEPSAMMEPGGNCIGCHGSGEGPRYTFAGTVMAAAHDDTNCAGVGAVTVAITGSDGVRHELTTNANGNFFATWPSSAVAFPYRAEVTRNGVTIPMVTARSAAETNCASCHTAVGANGAPGRIVAP